MAVMQLNGDWRYSHLPERKADWGPDEWSKFLHTYSSEEVVPVFMKNLEEIARVDGFEKVIIEAWVTAEFGQTSSTLWSHVFRLVDRKKLMEAGDQPSWEGNTVTVYRGVGSGAKKYLNSGMSWTIDRERAEWFASARRRAYLKGQLGFYAPPQPTVYQMEVNKEGVLFFTQVRKESEVVIDPRWMLQHPNKARKVAPSSASVVSTTS